MTPTGLYDRLILRHPVTVLFIIAVTVSVAAWQSRHFRLDASADSLTLENDAALEYYRAIRSRYGSDDFLVVTYSPASPLFDHATLKDLGRLRDQLRALEPVKSVTSILDVPLIQSPPVSLSQLATNIPTLASPDTDKALARRELLSSPVYRNQLISPDGRTTAIRVDLQRNPRYRDLREGRDALRAKRLNGSLSAPQQQRLRELSRELSRESAAFQGRLSNTVSDIRSVMDRYRGDAELHLGGVPMIIADSIGFIRHDLIVFGTAVAASLVIILTVAFRQPRWVILPLVPCAATGVIMVGLLGFLEWPVTVVSANFLSLLLIINLSLTIHLVVRYRELHHRHPHASQKRLVRSTVHSKAAPCFYTSLTTMVAFGSLLVSDVRPVIDFGWMMSIGVVCAFLVSFTLFPCAALLLKPGQPRRGRDIVHMMTRFTARLTRRHGTATLAVFGVLVLVSTVGVTRLTVENRFIDYFKDSTEIHQGMQLIDRKLGGTTPLDVIVDAPTDYQAQPDPTSGNFLLGDSTPDSGAAGITATSYWFNTRRLGEVEDIHASLDHLSATGKVLSIATAMRMLEQLSGDDSFDNFFLSILFERIPTGIREQLIDPYMSQDGNQLRCSIRVFETDPSLDRDDLVSDIRDTLEEEHGLEPSQVRLTGMLVLYNNMLHSLFRSQILTIAVVFLAILLMFLVLFRNLRLALAALVPNVFAAALVLGIMGWMGVPLDLMTITIAAISIGIAVDDTIHYVFRYRGEYRKVGSYETATERSHASIGRALFYTTLTISLGFSILLLSSFVPTIYFGLFTAIAMLAALAADLTLLPLLIEKIHAFGPSSRTRQTAAAGQL